MARRHCGASSSCSNLLGVDVIGWFQDLWDQIKAIPKGYLAAACTVQFGQTFFAGVSYYGILKYAYPAEVTLWPIVAAYSVGVALNGFLPANLGTFVTLIMFVAIIPSCTFAGALGAYVVQKIFFTLIGTFTYLYMFLSVPGAFDVSFSNLTEYPGLAIGIIVGAILLLVRPRSVALAKDEGQSDQCLGIARRTAARSSPSRRSTCRKSFLPSFLSLAAARWA